MHRMKPKGLEFKYFILNILISLSDLVVFSAMRRMRRQYTLKPLCRTSPVVIYLFVWEWRGGRLVKIQA